MSTGQVYGDIRTRTVTIDTDLSSKEYYAANFDATDDNNIVAATDASAIPLVIVEGGDGSSTETIGTIALPGSSVKVKLGGTVAPGDKLTATTGSKWIKTTTDTDNYGAVAMQIGVSNDVIEAEVVWGMIAG